MSIKELIFGAVFIIILVGGSYILSRDGGTTDVQTGTMLYLMLSD